MASSLKISLIPFWPLYQPLGWLVNTAKHLHIYYLIGSSMVSPIRQMEKQRPSETGVRGSESRLAPPWLSQSPALLGTVFYNVLDTGQPAACVRVQRGQAELGGLSYGGGEN